MLRCCLIFLLAINFITPALAQERTGRADNHGVELAFWTYGPQAGIPILIINGQGAATRPGGDGLSMSLAAKGFRVILFDNRDSGQSTILSSAGAPPSMESIAASLAAGEPPKVAYDLSDMADDAIAVLDAAGVDHAHVLGHSLGGMIAQVLAAEHPDRILSLMSASSTSGDPDLPFGPAMAALSEGPADASEPDAGQQAAIYRVFEGRAALRMADEEIAIRVAADMAVGDKNAAARQTAAVMATGDRRSLLKAVILPALVIHGNDDPWFPAAHAQSTAAALGGARIETIDGMGHIISDAAASPVSAAVAEFVRNPSKQR